MAGLELSLRTSRGRLHDPGELKESLKEAGFSQIQFAHLPTPPFYWGLVLALFAFFIWWSMRRLSDPDPLWAGALGVMGAISAFFFFMMVSVFHSSVREYSGSDTEACWLPAGFGELQLRISNAGKTKNRNLFMSAWFYGLGSYKVMQKI